MAASQMKMKDRSNTARGKKPAFKSRAGEKKQLTAKRQATEDASPSSVKRTKTSPVAKGNAAPRLNEGNAGKAKPPSDSKATRVLRPKKAENVAEQKGEAEAEQNEAEGSSSDSDSDTGALVQALDADSEDGNAAEKAVAVALAAKGGQDISDAARAVKERTGPGADDDGSDDHGVMYVGRLPNGFFEHEMRAYFSQFGPVTRLRVSRNKRTGASKGYAFIEFGSVAVCEIAAKTMDHYLLFGHILRCKVIPKDQVPPGLWKGANRRFKRVPWAKLAGRQLEQPASEATWTRRIEKEERRRSLRAKKLKELGYEFEGPKLRAVGDVERVEASSAPATSEALTVSGLGGDGDGEGSAANRPEAAQDVQQQVGEEKADARPKNAKAPGKQGRNRKA